MVFELGERRLHELNASAAAVWELWAGGVGRDEIVCRLAAQVHVAPAQLGADVDAAIDGFVGAGLSRTSLGSRRIAPSAVSPAAGLGPFRAGQARFRVVCRESWAGAIDGLLAGLRADGEQAEMVLAVDDSLDRPAALSRLMARINELAVVGSPDWVAFHAGVVTVEGGLVVLPGPSGRGKSTLTAALVAAGAAYLSDELALLDPGAGLVRPYPKPLALAGGHGAAKDLVDPHTIGALGAAAPVSAVVAPTFVAGGPTMLEPVSRRDALDLLLANSFDFGPSGEAGFQALVELAATVPTWRLQVCDLDEAVAAVARSVRPALTAAAGTGGRGHR